MIKVSVYRVMKKGKTGAEFLIDEDFNSEDLWKVKEAVARMARNGELKFSDSDVEYVVIPEAINEKDGELLDLMKIYREEEEN